MRLMHAQWGILLRRGCCYCCSLHLAGNKVSIAYAVPEETDVEGLQAIIDRQQLPVCEE